MSEALRQVLWRNISSLMTRRWGKENLARLAREGHFTTPTALRIKRGATASTIDLVEQTARVFRLEAWQLLDPDFDVRTAANVAARRTGAAGDAWPFAEISAEQFGLLDDIARAQVEGFVHALLPERPQR